VFFCRKGERERARTRKRASQREKGWRRRRLDSGEKTHEMCLSVALLCKSVRVWLMVWSTATGQGKILALDNSRLVLLPWGTQFPLHKMGWMRERLLWLGALKVSLYTNMEFMEIFSDPSLHPPSLLFYFCGYNLSDCRLPLLKHALTFPHTLVTTGHGEMRVIVATARWTQQSAYSQPHYRFVLCIMPLKTCPNATRSCRHVCID